MKSALELEETTTCFEQAPPLLSRPDSHGVPSLPHMLKLTRQARGISLETYQKVRHPMPASHPLLIMQSTLFKVSRPLPLPSPHI